MQCWSAKFRESSLHLPSICCCNNSYSTESCAQRHCGVATHRAPSVPFQARKAYLSTGKEAAKLFQSSGAGVSLLVYIFKNEWLDDPLFWIKLQMFTVWLQCSHSSHQHRAGTKVLLWSLWLYEKILHWQCALAFWISPLKIIWEKYNLLWNSRWQRNALGDLSWSIPPALWSYNS